MEWLYFILIGLVAGWLAGFLMRGAGFGILGNIILGIVGALLGGWLFSALGIDLGGTLGSIITATFGAIVLILIARLIRGTG